MKKIIFPALLIGTILVGGVLGYSIWKASPQTAEGYLKSGKEYYEAKKYSEAVVQFLNAVQKDPKSRDARYFLSLCYVNQGNLNAAVKQLTALLEVSPEDEQANLLLGRIYLTGGRSDSKFFRMSQDIADKILAKNPQNVEAMVLKGNALAGLQDYRASTAMFEGALKLDPNNAGILVNMGVTEAVQKNFAEAEATLLRARQADPKSRNALLSLANLYRVAGKNDNAEAMLKEAYAVDPTDKGIYYQLAGFYFQTGRLDQAEKILADAQDKNPQDPGPSLTLAALYTTKNQGQQAAKLLLDLKKKFPVNLDVAANVAEAFMLTDPTRAKTEIDQIIAADPKNPFGQILLGELQFQTGQFEAAEATLTKETTLSSPLPGPHYLLGRMADIRGDLDKAAEHYQKSLELNGSYILAREGLAEVFLKRGRTGDARTENRKVLDEQPSFVPARLLKSTLDALEKKYPEAEKELQALAKEQPENFNVHLRMGLYYQLRNQPADAEKSFLRALELQPNSVDILQALSVFYISQNKGDKAIQLVANVPASKKTAAHYELLGLVYTQTGKIQEAETAYKKVLEVDPKHSSSRGYLVSQYIKTGRFDDALQQLDELLKQDPRNASAYTTKGMIFASKGNIAAAKDSYVQALNINSSTFVAANNLANILADEGKDMDGALKWAQAARRSGPNDAAAADTLGWIQHKMGQHILARDQLQFAVSSQPDNPLYQYHLGLIYKDTKQPREAEAALKKSINSQFPFKQKTEAQAALAEISKR